MRLPSWVILLAFTVSSAKLEENVLKELGGAAGEITEEATTQSVRMDPHELTLRHRNKLIFLRVLKICHKNGVKVFN